MWDLSGQERESSGFLGMALPAESWELLHPEAPSGINPSFRVGKAGKHMEICFSLLFPLWESNNFVNNKLDELETR